MKVTLSDGIERVLRYTLRTMREAAEEFGGSITSQVVLRGMDENKLGKLLWYGLRADQPSLTVEQIEDLIEPPDVPYIMEQYWRAISASVPDQPKNGPGEQSMTPETEAIPTGSQSGPSPDTTSD